MMGYPVQLGREHQVGVQFVNFCTLAHVSLLFHTIFAFDKFSLRFDDFADRHSTIPQLSLVNR